ncbi:predicted protein [Naegleria gruberi]|uniref:Predicted protein n=1 Tax=Naegleria gruberi TaxID=5762 RepID=D2VFB8_NAEGR|nr:uncharacterized protein NAEGRDRAFT_67571 [Naegleria gruberi]EFC44342.1 predicted protein [Naegleria gruberi]|eukprot:XP_002677086.1 predicted protein [Naegleria gruberi strain NEG-M]
MDSKIGVAKFQIKEVIADLPLNKKICQALEKLGGKLPSIISKLQFHDEFIIPECLRYLFHVVFPLASKLLYCDKEVTKVVSFIHVKTAELLLEHDLFYIGNPFPINDPKSASLYVKKAEISKVSNNGDFPIYLRYRIDENSHIRYITKSFLFSEFISKVRIEYF